MLCLPCIAVSTPRFPGSPRAAFDVTRDGVDSSYARTVGREERDSYVQESAWNTSNFTALAAQLKPTCPASGKPERSRAERNASTLQTS